MISRRGTFGASLALFGGLIAAVTCRADAQQATDVARIGFLGGVGSPGLAAETLLDALRQGLGDLGYIEGRNITIEYRLAGGRIDRLPDLAGELVELGVQVIVASTPAAALAVKKATSTVPIVFAIGGDPQPTKFELVVNRKTAEALGLNIPQSILLRADEVIE
jgi:putative ABC transport system substrate-binding protein